MAMILFVVVSILSGALAAHHNSSCADVESACLANATCMPLWKSYVSQCSDVLQGNTKSCSASCNASFATLTENSLAADLRMCHCDSDNYTCQASRANFLDACFGVPPPPAAQCSPIVAEPDRPSDVTCPTLAPTCFGNSSCAAKLNLYLASCGGAFSGKTCTANCKNRLEDLSCDPLGRILYTGRERCICSYLDFSCFYATTYVNNLCYDTKYPEWPPVFQSCDFVYSACQLDPSCSTLYNDYIGKCTKEYSGPAECSKTCNDSANALFSHPIGWYYSNCVCGDQSCGVGSAYLYRNCYQIIAPVPTLCSTILSWCDNDVTCKPIGDAYLTACNPANVTSCANSQCKFAATKMLYNPVGALLNHCYCEDDDTDCMGYRKLTLSCGISTAVPPPPLPTPSRPISTTSVPTPTSGESFPRLSLALIFVLAVCLVF